MWKIKNRIDDLQSRTKVPKYEKFETKYKTSNVVRTERKKLYDYYKCDYCGCEIRLDKKPCERSGGLVDFPQTLTKRGKLTLVLCNKCLNKAINEFIERGSKDDRLEKRI